MKLISMTDFILSDEIDVLDENNFIKVCEYAEFLKQTLTLGMFVPCDEDGNVLEEPIDDSDRGRCEYDLLKKLTFKEKLEKYQKAKERVFFEGFEIFKESALKEVVISKSDSKRIYIREKTNVEDLINFDLTLTQTAIKKIGIL